MQQNPSSVYVADDQNGSLNHRGSEMPDVKSRGNLRDISVAGEADIGHDNVTSAHHAVRKGATWGALVGLLMGVTTLVASVMVAAAVGALLGKASQLRLDKGSAPRIHFAERKV